MNLDNMTSIDQLAEFLSGTQAVAFPVLSNPAARYEWMQKPSSDSGTAPAPIKGS